MYKQTPTHYIPPPPDTHQEGKGLWVNCLVQNFYVETQTLTWQYLISLGVGVFGSLLDHEVEEHLPNCKNFLSKNPISQPFFLWGHSKEVTICRLASLHQKLNQAEGWAIHFYCIRISQYKKICYSRPHRLGKLTNTETHTPCVYQHMRKTSWWMVCLYPSLLSSIRCLWCEKPIRMGNFQDSAVGCWVRWVG